MSDVAELAFTNGMHEVELVPPQVLMKLPMEFKQIGFDIHKRFDALSKQAKEGVTPAQVNDALADVMNGCAACHSSYQVALETEK